MRFSASIVGATLLLVVTAARADVAHQRIDRDQGLPSSQVHAIAQDPTGFLWFAGPAGLLRYEGGRLVHIGRPEGLSTQGLRSLAIDSRGQLWVGSDLGVDLLQSVPVGSPTPLAGFRDGSKGFVEKLLVDPTPTGDRVWLATSQGLYLRSEDRVAQACLDEIGTALVTDIADASRGRVWATAPGQGLFLADANSCSTIELNFGLVSTVVATTSTTLMVGSDLGLFEFDVEANRISRSLVSGLPVSALLHDQQRLWVAAGNQLLEFHKNSAGWSQQKVLASAVDINQLYLDHQGNLWAATDGQGVLKFSPFREAIRRLETPCSTQVYSFGRLSEDRVFVGGASCSWWMDLDSGKTTFTVDSLEGNKVWDVLDAGGTQAWAATELGLYSSTDRKEWSRDSYGLQPLENPGRCLLDVGVDQVWVGTVTGLFSVDASGARELLTADGEGLGYVYTLESDPRTGDTWIGTIGNGVWRASAKGPIERVQGKDLRANANVYSIAIGPERTMVAQDDQLLELRAGSTTELPRVSKDPVAAWSSVLSPNGTLWIGSSVGLERYGPDGGIRLTSRVGLAGDEFTTSRSLLDLGDSLLAGTSRGVSIIDRAALGAMTLPSPRVQLVEARWQNVEPEEDESGRFSVPSGRWTLDVTALAPWFLDEAHLRYQFRMLGFNDEWSAPLDPARAQVRFTGLPAGDYRLEGRATSELVGSGPVVELLRLQVRPDWWQRWEFWILGLVGLGVMVRLGWNARSRQLRHQASMLEKTVRERTRELKEVSDVLREQALQDRLTGLANRRQMENQFGRFVARAERNGEPFSLAVIDLNHFKLVNDRYGHTVGDLLLRHVAEHLTGASRPFDLVSRWGGDEFVILLQGADSRAAEDILERIRTMFAEEPLVLDDGSRLFASVSFGVSTWSTGSDELESLFRQADRRVYEDKARTPQS